MQIRLPSAESTRAHDSGVCENDATEEKKSHRSGGTVRVTWRTLII